MSRPSQGNGTGNGNSTSGNNGGKINTNPNPNGGAGSASGLDRKHSPPPPFPFPSTSHSPSHPQLLTLPPPTAPPNTPITNPTDPWKSKAKVIQRSPATSTDDIYETSESSGRYRKCGDPPTFKPPTEKPPPPKPKEGEKPPEPVKQTQIRTQPGVEF